MTKILTVRSAGHAVGGSVYRLTGGEFQNFNGTSSKISRFFLKVLIFCFFFIKKKEQRIFLKDHLIFFF